MTFPEWSPCIYKGAIFCKDCERNGRVHRQLAIDDDDCDMAANREAMQKAFHAGYNEAIKP